MGTKDDRIDAYIAKSADFAKPILKHLRGLIHHGCPQVEETLKWGFPHFMHKGILCSMAAFNQHCAFGFWKQALILGDGKDEKSKKSQAMGQFGRLQRLADLPPKKILLGYIKKAAELNDAGVKAPYRKKQVGKRPPLVVQAYFKAALKKNKKALNTFETFSPSHQREYVEWITEAKTEETRQRRLATSLEWLADGKTRNWKYANC